MKQSIIKLESIRKTYDKKRYVLDGLSLDVKAGEFIALLGRSGAGKSTTLNLLGCLDPNYEGSYSLFLGGEKIAISEHKKRYQKSKNRAKFFSFIFQDGALLEYLTVKENVLLPLRFAHQKEDPQKLADLLKELEIDELADKKVNQLSGGERQRVGIARALMQNAPIILADEPTGSLDYWTIVPVVRLLKEAAKKRGKTVIVVTHNLDILPEFDRVLELKNGKFQALPRKR
jgi:putative ABC transport system ATP-binding protein